MESPVRLAPLRELLRHLDHPQRLRSNTLAAPYFADGADAADATVRIRNALEQALAELSHRQRRIIQRCDLRGESHASVARDLAISERHFYRERRTATERLQSAFEQPAHDPKHSDYAFTRDPVALQLCLAETAQQAGDASRALAILAAAANDDIDPATRVRLECRMAELRCESGAIAKAKAHVENGRRIAAQCDDASNALDAEVAAVEAVVSWSGGDVETASRCSLYAVTRLRRALATEPTPAQGEATALARLVLSENDARRGRWTPAREKALEARDVLSACNSTRAALGMRAAITATDAYIHDPQRLELAAYEYRQHYREAVARGLSLEAVLIGCRLGHFHRFAAAPQRAVEVLESILPVARALSAAEELSQICLDLASAYCACGRPALARERVAEARRHAFPHGFLAALCNVMAADVCVQEGAYARAIRLTGSAQDALRRLNREAAAGSALRIAAQAHHALGEQRIARSRIGEALESIQNGGHPFVVAKIHNTAARITGKSVHRRLANELFASLAPRGAGPLAGRVRQR